MKISINIATLSFLLCLTTSVYSQNNKNQENNLEFSKIKEYSLKNGVKTDASFQYSFKNFDIKQGLKSSYITKLLIDNTGCLWFGTLGAGAGKYNGKTFSFITENNGLSGNIVQDIFIDNNKNIWLATPENGVCFYNGYKFKNYTKEDGLVNNDIWFITEYNNQIWFGSRSSGISIYENGEFKKFSLNDSLIKYICCLYPDKNKNMWICTENGSVFKYNGKKIIDYSTLYGIDNYKIQSIAEDNKGNIYFGSYGGGLLISKDDSIIRIGIKDGLSNLYINKLLLDKEKVLWIATSGGGIFTYENNRASKVLKNDGITNDVILDIVEDNNGMLWFATYGGGISRFNGKMFSHFSKESGFASNIIKTITDDYNKNLLFGTSGGGLIKFEGKSLEQFSISEGINSRFIMSATKDKNGNIYLGTSGGGINIINKNKIKYITTENGLRDNYILSVLHSSKNILWIGTYRGGIIEYDGETIKYFNQKNGFNAETVNVIAESSNGDIWFGTEKKGVIKYNGIKFISYNKKNGLNNNKVTDIYEDKNNIIWITTFGGGITKLENGNFEHISSNNLIDNNYINSITEDRNGNLWFGTSNGLIKFINTNNSSIYQSSDLPAYGKYKIKTYGDNEGFTGNNCLTNSAFEDKSGNIWFGTGKKLTKYSPNHDLVNDKELTIVLNEVNLSLKTTNWKKIDTNQIFFDNLSKWNNLPVNLVLQYNQNRITFNFTGINIKSPEKVRYKFRLIGFENDWSPVTKKSEVSYSNLMPGTFTFEAMAMNEDGFWTKKPISFSFIITPPWWKTLWFRILTILAIIFLIYIFIKFRERKLKRDKQRLEKIVDERTIEIKEKNEILQQANEEIIAQRDEIEAQRDMVQVQKEQIEEIHHEVKQSIRYAQRIQSSILPEGKIITKNFADYFIVFIPRDVVSGDFYWIAEVENHTIITAADCTGHGVPGAFMSMLGISFLREIVTKEYVTHPAVILRKLRKEIINLLQQKGEFGEQKDGLDMALISVNHSTNILQFAGANNPMYLVRDNLLTEIKGDKMPIAIYEKMDKFSVHEIQLQKNDTIYLFSDGFPDQFGGPKGKKFKYKPFKELITTNATKPMAKQKQILENAFEDWKQNYEQVDDVVVIGIKI